MRWNTKHHTPSNVIINSHRIIGFASTLLESFYLITILTENYVKVNELICTIQLSKRIFSATINIFGLSVFVSMLIPATSDMVQAFVNVQTTLSYILSISFGDLLSIKYLFICIFKYLRKYLVQSTRVHHKVMQNAFPIAKV